MGGASGSLLSPERVQIGSWMTLFALSTAVAAKRARLRHGKNEAICTIVACDKDCMADGGPMGAKSTSDTDPASIQM